LEKGRFRAQSGLYDSISPLVSAVVLGGLLGIAFWITTGQWSFPCRP